MILSLKSPKNNKTCVPRNENPTLTSYMCPSVDYNRTVLQLWELFCILFSTETYTCSVLETLNNFASDCLFLRKYCLFVCFNCFVFFFSLLLIGVLWYLYQTFFLLRAVNEHITSVTMNITFFHGKAGFCLKYFGWR